MYDLKKGIEISFNDKLLKYWEDTRQAYYIQLEDIDSKLHTTFNNIFRC